MTMSLRKIFFDATIRLTKKRNLSVVSSCGHCSALSRGEGTEQRIQEGEASGAEPERSPRIVASVRASLARQREAALQELPSFDVPKLLSPIGKFIEATDPEVLTYWRHLYDEDYDGTKRVLRVGQILYRRNVLDRRIKDLFVRDVYPKLYTACDLDLAVLAETIQGADDNGLVEHFFFTGTPGVGTPCFRTYMMWRHIQELKEKRLTGVIWASKSPARESYAELLLIEDGAFRGAFRALARNWDLVATHVEMHRIMTLAHVDVSKGDSDDIPDEAVITKYNYTSPSWKAWHEKLRVAGCLYVVPEWEVDELVDFFYDMQKHPVLMERLNERMTDMSVPVEAREVAKQVVEEEAFRFGHVPRDMFLSGEALNLHIALSADEVSQLQDASFNISVGDFKTGLGVRHSLCSFIGSDFRTHHLEWRGQFVADLVADRIVSTFVFEDLEAPAAVNRLFPSDPKLLERALLAIFPRRPDVFRLHGLDGSAAIDSGEIDFRLADGRPPTPLRGVTNDGLAAFASDLDRRGVVTPISDFPTGIDGIARFTYQGAVVTAFLQVAAEHPIGPEDLALIGRLAHLADCAAAGRTQRDASFRHRCVLLWLCRPVALRAGQPLDPSFNLMDTYLMAID